MKPSLAKHFYIMLGLARPQDQGVLHYMNLMNCSPIYTPKKHTKMSYRAQQRAAKKRRK
jgi:hypothetical protein